MSTKIYGGRRRALPPGGIQEWQQILRAARKTLNPKTSHWYETQYAEMVQRERDLTTITGNPRPDATGKSAYEAWREMRSAARDGQREHIDHECSVSWMLDGNTIYAMVFGSPVDKFDVDAALGVTDYHYQDQTDPDGCSYEEMQERGKVWSRLLDEFKLTPADVMHSFTLAEGPPGLPMPRKSTWTLDERALSIARELFTSRKMKEEGASVMAIFHKVSDGKYGAEFDAYLADVKAKLKAGA